MENLIQCLYLKITNLKKATERYIREESIVSIYETYKYTGIKLRSFMNAVYKKAKQIK